MKGDGVVSTKNFEAGSFIVEYVARLRSGKEGAKKEEEYAEDPTLGSYMYF